VYEGSARKWLHADPRGSIIAQTDSSGNATAINSYGITVTVAITPKLH
jgi:hypothetical protein